ncbi:hypothetical protein FB45DRAFT_925560 [Roridomyces roridus]|uniref:Uncharacterized protein n=1 Tax=Roridomyces roridus TaxID=1738132 RepID=A0AAD7BJX0_9AGAR|nr:hypothetical protein FB45DRAFT_925560 [Roridomyces roridus]
MSWCLDQCLDCDRVVDASCSSGYCSPVCEAAASHRHEEQDDDDDDQSYSSWLRVKAWAESLPPTSPTPRVFVSPSKRILTPQHPTACLTSDSPLVLENPRTSPRPARTAAPTTAAESLVASSAGPVTPISLGSLVRWAAPRPHLPRITTSFTILAKAHPAPPLLLPSDESDSDVSPVWWVGHDPESSSSSPSKPRCIVQHRGRQRSRPRS